MLGDSGVAGQLFSRHRASRHPSRFPLLLFDPALRLWGQLDSTNKIWEQQKVISANPSKGGDAKPPVYWNAARTAQRSYDSGVATLATDTMFARPLAYACTHFSLRFEPRASTAMAASFPEQSSVTQRRSPDRRCRARSQGTSNDSNNFREDRPAASAAGVDCGVVERMRRR
jgi:hypothetical protein